MKKSKRIKENKAVILIALVVTIVVLIILAGISISALTGDKGIINQAHTAKEDTEIASWEEQIDLAIIDAEKKYRNPTLDDVKEELKNKGVIDEYSQVNEDGVITTNEPSYTIEGKLDEYIKKSIAPGVTASKNEPYIDKKEDKAIIPAGFKVSENEKEQTIDDGLVIKDGVGNEFVWVPVIGVYERNTTYNQISISQTSYTDTGYLPEGIQPATDDATNNEKAEKEAVLNKGGFYISRYEAGKEGTNKLVSKAGATVWINISQENCKTEAKKFINNDNVKSSLCSGIQWDMTMKFISENDKNFDVTVANPNRHIGSSVAISGNNSADKACNIYDLEGNAREYVAEKNTYEKYGEMNYRGYYWFGYSLEPASYRYGIYGSANSGVSFRFTLYVM